MEGLKRLVRLHHRMAGAQLPGLIDAFDPLPQVTSDLSFVETRDDDRPADAGGLKSSENVIQERPVIKPVQDLGSLRAHPLAFARSQDNCSDFRI